MGRCSQDTKAQTLSCHEEGGRKRDYFFLSVIVLGMMCYLGHLLNLSVSFAEGKDVHLFHSFFDLMNLMIGGIILGIVLVGVLGKIPREYVISIIGRPGTKSGLLRATLAGLLLDLCNHGILMVGMKLYERGASLGQTMAFLIASPWNSLSLTIILVSLIGFKWTLAFILLSGLIAIISGILFDILEKRGVLLKNPNQFQMSKDFRFWKNIKKDMKNYNFSMSFVSGVLRDGLKDSKMIIKWILFGAILSSLVKTFVDQGAFENYFGPTFLGLGVTLVLTTIMEICSEGASPFAADLMTRASAPGNSFTFLMAGVSTDYTEIMSLKETTKSFKIALFLPLITVPQILIIGFILNSYF